jgi:hypothetical protein
MSTKSKRLRLKVQSKLIYVVAFVVIMVATWDAIVAVQAFTRGDMIIGLVGLVIIAAAVYVLSNLYRTRRIIDRRLGKMPKRIKSNLYFGKGGTK